MNDSVIIKGNKNGMVVILDKELPFPELKISVAEKFSSASKFFENANMAVTFEGRELSQEEELELLNIITNETSLNIVCVIDNNEMRQEYFKRAVDAKMAEVDAHSGQFYKGTLRSGQVLESESSIIILGDVNPGGKVIAKGNVIVLGCLKGNIFAGASGDENAFVVAIDMDPMQIRIGNVIARSSDSQVKSKLKKSEARIAYVEDGNIYIEKLERDVLSDIRI